jgi:hypothetical protein
MGVDVVVDIEVVTDRILNNDGSHNVGVVTERAYWTD